MRNPTGYIIRHNRDGEFGLWPAGDGTSQFRDYFTVHENRDWNWSVFTIFIHVGEEALRAEDQFAKRHGEDSRMEALLTWCVERIERGLRDGEFKDGPNRIYLEVGDFQLLEGFVAEKRCDYQFKDGRDVFCTATVDYTLGVPRQHQ